MKKKSAVEQVDILDNEGKIKQTGESVMIVEMQYHLSLLSRMPLSFALEYTTPSLPQAN